MPLRIFQSDLGENLKRLSKGTFGSAEERDRLLQAIEQAEGLKPKDVVWMAYRPDRSIREAAVRILANMRTAATIDQFVADARDKSEGAVRAGSQVLFALKIPGVEGRLSALATAEDGSLRDAARSIVVHAPPSPSLTPLLWRLVDTSEDGDRLRFLQQLAQREVGSEAMPRWQRAATDTDIEVRSIALKVLADSAPDGSVDHIVDGLSRVDYATQQHLIGALAKVAQSRGADFIDRLLPLMASGEAGIRSAVLKILLQMDDRHELVKRYLRFSTSLAGWARDRALDSMKEFGDDLVEPTIELLSDSDEEVRALALVVAASFDDERIVPATIGLLEDDDWWLRVSAADTLGRFRDPRAVDALVAKLADSEARWAAVEALGRIGDPRSLPALAKLFNDPAPEIRIEALLALRNFNHPKILEAIRKVAENDTERGVRVRALEVAEEIARRGGAGVENVEQLRSDVEKVTAGEGEARLHGYLVATRNQGGSDFHLAVGCPATIRVGGELIAARGESFTRAQVTSLLREVLSDEQWAVLERDKQLDFCYYIPGVGRYRTNVFQDQRGLNAVFRVIPVQPPTIHEIGLPNHLAEISACHQGLVLVCGPAGSGKSTTLAALVNLFNDTRHAHVLTLEDPVEFVHPFKNCLINQREVGSDTRSFARALRAALRENPDVIVIGDLRDNESISLALTAAETGHLVLGTLSSTSAPKAVDRTLNSFPHDEQPQVRAALSESLKYIIAQRLIPVSGTRRRVACFEVLIGTFSVANLIREDRTIQLPSAMQIGRSQGMMTFDDSLRELVSRRQISAESAYVHATNKGDFESMVSEEFLKSRTFL